MNPRFIPFRVGFTNVFLLVQDGIALLVDTGTTGLAGNILKKITAFGVDTNQLKYIFLTHSHYDHAGSVADLKAITGAKIIIHSSEADSLKDGFTPIPFGTNLIFKFISSMGRTERMHHRIASYPAVVPDIVFSDGLDLKEFGFDAKIIPTPGHTEGSCSLIFENNILVGDTMFNMMGSIYPGFANDEAGLKLSWEKLLNMNVEWLYPSHGRRISMGKFKTEAHKILS